MDIRDFMTAGITPEMVPGIRRAIELCEEYAAENMSIAYAQMRVLTALPTPTSYEKFAPAYAHGDKRTASDDIARLLRMMIGEETREEAAVD